MATLETDTLFYRHDHPLGFMFSAGNEAPSEDDGWALAPEDVQPAPEAVYECTTLAAFSELLRTERDAAWQQHAELQLAMQRLGAATSVIAALQTEIERLNERVAEMNEPEEQP